MKEFFRKYKKTTEEYLRRYFKQNENKFSRVYPGGGQDACKRLALFVTQGKMVRGSLVILSYLMFKKRISPEVVKIAAAVELFHSALLVHDDIMDRDILRRGKATIFYQYQKIAQKKKFQDPYHFGISSGICAGDICFFLGFEILTQLKVKPAQRQEIIEVCVKELTKVGLAQMYEMYLGSSNNKLTEDDIISVYKYKTARYTFSLPLLVGALLANQGRKVITKLNKLGEYLGIIFQIKDDELGLFGSEKIIGKPVGSDIKETKKTLFYFYLWQRASEKERRKLRNIFGQSRLTKRMLLCVLSLIEQYGIRKEVNKTIGKFRNKGRKLIISLSIPRQYQQILLEIMDYIVARNK